MNEEKIDKFDKLVLLIAGEVEIGGKNYLLKEEFEKFFVHGNKSSGTRVRKIMQDIKKVASEVRKDVQEYKNNL